MSRDSLKFKTACINPPGPDRPGANKGGEYVLLERHGSQPVKGCAVDQRVYAHDGSTRFEPFKTLTTEPPAEVTEILIRGGEGQEHMDGTRLVIYTGHRTWQLNNAEGEVLRLRDARGEVLHERRFPANFCAALPPAPKPPKPVRPPVVSAGAAIAHGEAL